MSPPYCNACIVPYCNVFRCSVTTTCTLKRVNYVSYCNTTRTCIDTHVGTKSVSGTATGHGTRCANTHMHLTKRAHMFRMHRAYINDTHLSGSRQCTHSYTGCNALVSMIKQHTQLKYGYSWSIREYHPNRGKFSFFATTGFTK